MGKSKIAALLLGREGSVGFPGKNIFPVLGRPMMVYPLLAAKNCKYIDNVFLSTDSKKMKEIALSHGIEVIDRPAELCTAEALSEDAWVHGYNYIKGHLKADIEFMVLLFCNAPTIIAEKLKEGIEILRSDGSLDSAATVSRYNMYSPVRARKIGPDGTLQPFVPLEWFYANGKVNSDRSGLGDVYFADCSGYVVRPRCLENINDGMLPQKWMGRRIAPVKNWGGLDIDYAWEVPQAEYWLKENGFSATALPYLNDRK
jgi:CMP-N-acetylneuraminic acid synthetase